MTHDADFPSYVAELLSGVPGVTAVALGGSRAAGTHRPDSDWDFSLYYRGRFDPRDLRALGWPGEIFPIGGWGGGVFNGGAWLRTDGRRVDVHYRDLDEVEHHIAEAREGRFRIERLLFYLAGVPTYIVVAELAVNVVLHGDLPSPGEYPERLRETAHRTWLADARHTLGYARDAYASRGRVAETAGAIALAFAQGAHAALAARGEWITNEKALLDQAGFRRAGFRRAGFRRAGFRRAGFRRAGLRRAGLRSADEVLAGLTAGPRSLAAAVDAARDLIDETAGN